MADATMADALVQPCGVHRGRAVFNALNSIAVDDLAIEIQKHHHDSDLLRTLVADLREKRVDLKEFCIRVRMLLGAPVLVATIKGLLAAQSFKKAQLQQREHQLASPVKEEADECVVLGARSREERDAELRRSAVDVEEQATQREVQLEAPAAKRVKIESKPVVLGAPAGGLWSLQSTVADPTPPSTASTAAADASPAAAGGYADQTEVNSLKRKVEVLQQAIITHQRHDAENAAIKQRLAGKRMLLDSSALERSGLTWCRSPRPPAASDSRRISKAVGGAPEAPAWSQLSCFGRSGRGLLQKRSVNRDPSSPVWGSDGAR